MFCTIEDAWGISSLQGARPSASGSVLEPTSQESKESPHYLKDLQSSTEIKSINNDKISNKEMFEQSDKPESFKLNEYTFHEKSTNNEEIKQDMYNKYMELKEMFEDKYSPVEQKVSEVCLALDNHLSKCERCRSKYLLDNKQLESQQLNQYNNGIDLSKISIYINSNKDTITIFLFGVLIILLLQLFSSK